MPSALHNNALTLVLLPLIGAMFLFASQGHAQSGKAIDLPVNWQVGEQYKIEMTKERERYRNGIRHTGGQAIVPVDIEVLRKLEDGYIIRWTYGKTRFSGAKVNQITSKIANITENMRLDMRTDGLGSITGLDNKEEIRTHYQAAAKELTAWMQQLNLPQNVVDQITATFAGLAQSNTLSLSAVREPSLFYLAFGGSYQLGEAVEFDDLISNPWGQAPIPTKARLFLKELDQQQGTATIAWKQVFDRDKAGPILQKSMTAIGLPVPEGEKVFSGLAMDDDALWIFDSKTGWLLSGSWQRTTKINGKLAGVERIKYRTLP